MVCLLLCCCRWAECGKLGELSPAAVEQLQAACTQAVTQAYADGVDALVFVPPKRGKDATSEEAAAAEAAAEAAMKIQKNKQVGGTCAGGVLACYCRGWRMTCQLGLEYYRRG